MPERFIMALALCMIFACESKRPMHVQGKAPAEKRMEEFREALISQNRQLIREEMLSISAYAIRKGMNMDSTSTGLRYLFIARNPAGKKTGLMKDVTIAYSMELLDGTPCYSSDSSGLLTFTLGQSNEPSGLQEGLLRMREGEEAVLIVPSFLAYGVTGDGNRVPGSSSIVYRLKLEKVKD